MISLRNNLDVHFKSMIPVFTPCLKKTEWEEKKKKRNVSVLKYTKTDFR